MSKSTDNMALSLIRRGLIREVRPSTAQILKILEPMMLPTEISFSFRNTAMSEVANSGTLVPKATIEIPMTLSLTPQFSARDLAPRSEERRVGKECRSRWGPEHSEEKEENSVGESVVRVGS